MLESIGPNPTIPSRMSGTGLLRVYSARERVPIDVNAEEFFWNNDYGKNDFLHGEAHTDYTLYAMDGRVLQRVHNTNGQDEARPTTVKLSPGLYRIEAAAEDYDDVTWTVMAPIVIEAGLTTTVHLDGGWNPLLSPKKRREMVCLPNGRAVGWPGSKLDGAESRPQSKT